MQDNLLGYNEEGKSNSYTFYGVLLLILLVVFYLSTSVFSLVKVEGSSMYSTLVDGDVLFVNRALKADRGDVIVFDYPSHGMVIKRVIAIEGDEIKCENDKVHIKYAGTNEFVILNEPYLSVDTPYFPSAVIGEGELFVMGDNRPISEDSKIYGPIKKEYVKGVVTKSTIKNKKVITSLFGWAFKFSE
ncbi:MAG: signal peptidase I [Clostridia bacterium]|nr:signal peptidase I [Clostridia bacterium]